MALITSAIASVIFAVLGVLFVAASFTPSKPGGFVITCFIMSLLFFLIAIGVAKLGGW